MRRARVLARLERRPSRALTPVATSLHLDRMAALACISAPPISVGAGSVRARGDL
jgi:hypothetical protein